MVGDNFVDATRNRRATNASYLSPSIVPLRREGLTMSNTKIVVLFIAGVFMSSCSVYMAAKQPEKKNFAVLIDGGHHSLMSEQN